MVDVCMSEDEIARLEALCAAASPAPWISFVEGREHDSGSSFIQTPAGDIELSGATTSDQDFIAAARSGVPSLVAEVRRLRRLLHTLDRSGST
jgi:hypothetical protein